ncbi:MAG: transposase family protein, partial [Pyrinomonadaceae bacterium]
LGDFSQTLDLNDVCTGWTEIEAVPNKVQVSVFEAIQPIRKRLPFPLLGLDSDNGSEFVNNELLRYSQQERITFTRARPYLNNDNCYVEQKNYSVVRQTVGYQRFDTTAELMCLKQLYLTLRLYTNFFQPTMNSKQKRALRQSSHEKLRTTANAISTGARQSHGRCRPQTRAEAAIQTAQSGRLERRGRQIT